MTHVVRVFFLCLVNLFSTVECKIGASYIQHYLSWLSVHLFNTCFIFNCIWSFLHVTSEFKTPSRPALIAK